MKKTETFQARQGDVYLHRIDKVPGAAKEVARENGRTILATGESTGHFHSFGSARCTLYAVADEFTRTGCGYLVVTGKQAAPLTHQEHAPIKVPPGVYRVVRQRSYSEGVIEKVAD